MDDKKIQYNVTIKILKEIEMEWLAWMKSDHIPDVMKTQCFVSSKICKMLFPKDEDGETYSVQYLSENISSFNKYNELYASQLQKDHQEKYNEKFVAFRSVMEVDNEFSNVQ